jgi:hypothetical protein
MLKPTASFALFALLLGGCAVTPENVDEVWSSTSYALTDAETQVATSTALSLSTDDLSVEADCEDGGTISVSGSWGGSDLLDMVTATFDLDAAFHGCQSEGVTIDGDLSWALSAQVDDGASLEYAWSGQLAYSGKYVGDCAIAMTASASATGSTASASYEGTICGYDASATLSASY